MMDEALRGEVAIYGDEAGNCAVSGLEAARRSRRPYEAGGQYSSSWYIRPLHRRLLHVTKSRQPNPRWAALVGSSAGGGTYPRLALFVVKPSSRVRPLVQSSPRESSTRWWAMLSSR